METNEATIISTMKLKTNTNERESGLELLRIIAMIFIIMHHIVDVCYVLSFSVNKPLLIIFHQNGKIGVIIFIFISSYFVVKREFSFIHVIKVTLPTIFYSICLYFISLLITKEQFQFEDFLYYLFPISNDQYWFVTCYIFLIFLSPILNLFINSINKREYEIICLILIFLEIIFPYLTPSFRSYPNFNNIIHFCVIYFWAGYIRLYKIKINKILLIFILLLLFLLTKILMPIYGLALDVYILITFSNVTISFIMFMIFKDLKIKSKFINQIASTSFGVYLIHTHKSFYMILWKMIISLLSFIGNNSVIFVLLPIVCYILCSIVDYARIKILHNNIIKLVKIFNLKLKDIFLIK